MLLVMSDDSMTDADEASDLAAYASQSDEAYGQYGDAVDTGYDGPAGADAAYLPDQFGGWGLGESDPLGGTPDDLTMPYDEMYDEERAEDDEEREEDDEEREEDDEEREEEDQQQDDQEGDDEEEDDEEREEDDEEREEDDEEREEDDQVEMFDEGTDA
jgi:hypothetical protein